MSESDVSAVAVALAKALARFAEMATEISENFHKDLGLEVPKPGSGGGSLKRKTAGGKPAVDPRAPKKPKTAYMLFNEWAREQAKSRGEAAPPMAKLGEEWNAMSEAEKAKFVEEAEKLKDVYLKEIDKYKEELAHDNNGDVPPPTSH